jgi:hypothetical protein
LKYEEQARAGGTVGDEAMDYLEYKTSKYVLLFLCFAILSIFFMNVLCNWG